MLLTVNIAIFNKQIQTKKHMIVKNSEEKSNFLAKLSILIKRINIEYIASKKVLERIV